MSSPNPRPSHLTRPGLCERRGITAGIFILPALACSTSIRGLAREVLRVFEYVRDAEDGAARHLGLVKAIDQLIHLLNSGPVADKLIDRVAIGDALMRRIEPLVGG